VPPDVTWLGSLVGCGAWLGVEMDPPFCVVELLLLLVPLLGELLLLLLVPLLGELLLLLLVPLLGEVVASAG
jgi:hypothetical protein